MCARQHGRTRLAQAEIGRLADRHTHHEGAADAQLAFDLDAAAGFQNDASGNGKAEAGAADLALFLADLFELAEEFFLAARRHAGAGVAHADFQLAVDHRGRDEHAAFPGEFYRIANEIEENLTQTLGIEGQQARNIGGDPAGDLDALFVRTMRQHFHNAFDHLAKIVIARVELETPGFNGREIE